MHILVNVYRVARGDFMVIFKGKEAVCGILLTIDRGWRYKMTAEDTLIVKIVDEDRNVLTKTYTHEACDDIDKYVTVELSPEETQAMSLGRGTITAYLNDLVVIRPTEFYVKEAI